MSDSFQIGEVVLVEFPHAPNLEMAMKILEVKTAYGRTRYVVTPVSGKGSATLEHIKKLT